MQNQFPNFVYDPADVNAQVGEINANYEERVAKMNKAAWTQPKLLSESDPNDAAALSAMQDVCDMLSADYPGYDFYIEDVYFDYGQDWMWTTIVYDNERGGVQLLNPREFETLVELRDADSVYRSIVTDKYFPLRDKTAQADRNGIQLSVGDVIDGPDGCYVLAEEEDDCFEAYEYANFEAGTWTLWKDDLGEYAKIDSVDESPWIAEEYMISANRKLTSGLELNWHQDPINFEWTAFFGGGNLACVEPDSMMSSFGEETWVATVYDVNDTNLFWGMYDTAEEGKAKCEEYISSHGLVASRSAQVNIDSDMYDNEEDLAEAIVDALQSTDYEDLGPALNDICNDPKLFAVLRDLFGGGIGTLELSSTEVAVPVADLYPCQNEIGLDNSLAYPLEGNTDIGVYFNDPVTIVRPIVTYEGTYIIDGHHRWSQVFMLNPDAEITALDITGGNLDPTEVLRIAQGAIAAANGSVPSSSSQGINVYDSSDDEIWSYIDNTMVESAEEGMEEETGIEGREAVIEYICENVDELKTQHGPTSSAPDRDYMPQTDDGSLDLLDKGVEEI